MAKMFLTKAKMPRTRVVGTPVLQGKVLMTPLKLTYHFSMPLTEAELAIIRQRIDEAIASDGIEIANLKLC